MQEDFSAFYRAINEHDEVRFTAKPTSGLFPPGAYHSEGHQDGMGVCLYPALMVIKRYIAFESARQRKSGELRSMVPETDRDEWLERRRDGIFRDMKQFLKFCESNNKPGLYGAPYIVEADQFASVEIARNWGQFGAFINAMNQTFVEPIDKLNGKGFFHDEMRRSFPHLFEAFTRIRLLRHNADHLRLRQNVESELARMLDSDLFGARLTTLKEPWFMLQQICLDETFAAIQYERVSLES